MAAPAKKKRKKKKQLPALPEVAPVQPRFVKCMVCARKFKRITRSHVAFHDLTLSAYQANGWPVTPQQQQKDITVTFEGEGLDELAHRIAQEPKFVEEMGKGLVNKLLAQESKGKLIVTISRLISQRLTTLHATQALQEKVFGELAQEWRLTEGGEDGGDTSTADLLAMFNTFEQTRAKSEDVILRTLKLLLDEEKMPLTQITSQSGEFSGEHEQEPILAGITPDEQKQVLTLLKGLAATTGATVIDSDGNIVDAEFTVADGDMSGGTAGPDEAP